MASKTFVSNTSSDTMDIDSPKTFVSTSPFQLLPHDVMADIGMMLSTKDVLSLSSCTKNLQYLLDNNQSLWKRKLASEITIHLNYNNYSKSFKNIYLDHMGFVSCGFNKNGQLGDDILCTNVFQKTKPIKVKQIACGAFFSVVIDIYNNVWVTGDNKHGQLGLKDTVERNTYVKLAFKAKYVACGAYHIFLIKMDGIVVGCGKNSYGQLGLGDFDDRHTFHQIPINNIYKISCGDNHSMILCTDGNVYGCGYNHDRQALQSVDYYPYNISRFTHIVGDVKDVVCKANHSIIIDSKDDVYVVGTNYCKQLIPSSEDTITILRYTGMKAKKVACGNTHTVIIDVEDNAIILGTINYTGKTEEIGNCSNIKIYFKVKDASCGYKHCMLIDMDNQVWCIGNNNYGQLGIGNQEFVLEPTKIPNLTVKEIACGFVHTLAITI